MQGDRKRAAFIEFFCSSKEVVSAYDLLLSQSSKAKIKVDSSVKLQKNLLKDKKKLKKDVEMTNVRFNLVNDFATKAMEFDLFKICHNNMFLESAYAGMVEYESQLDDLKQQRNDRFRSLNANREIAGILSEEEDELKIELDDALDDQQNTQKNFIETKAKIDTSKFEDLFKDELQKVLATSQNMIDEATKEVQDLEHQAESTRQLLMNHENFLELQEDFESKNGAELLSIALMKTISDHNEVDSLKVNINRHKESEQKEKKKICLMDQQIDELKSKLKDTRMKSEHIEQSEIELQSKKNDLEELEEFLAANDKSHEKLQVVARQKAFTELKKQFPSRVVGRLSKLWTSAENVVRSDDEFIRKRLGKYSEAIVVDTTETAEECVAYLKSMLGPHDEIFLPLNHHLQQKATKSFLPNEKLPTKIVCDVIESLFNANSPAVEKTLLFCLRPSLVFESLKDAESCLTWHGAKKLDVVSTTANTCFRKNGLLERHKNAPGSEWTEEELANAEETLSARRKSFAKAKFEVSLMKPELITLQREIAHLTQLIKKLQSSKALRQNILDFHASKRNDLELKLEELKPRIGQSATLEAKLKAMETKERAHFKEFCTAVGVENVHEYLKKSQESLPPEVIAMKIAMVNEEIDKRKEDQTKIRSMIFSMCCTEAEDEIENLRAVDQELTVKKPMLEALLDELIDKEQEYFDLMTEMTQNKLVDAEIFQQIFDTYEKIYNDLHHIQMCFKENFHILTSNYMQQNPVTLSMGTMERFIFPPEVVPENFHLVQDQLKL